MRSRSQAITLATLAISLLAHAGVVAAELRSAFPEPYIGFRMMFVVLVAASAVASFVVFLSPSMVIARVMQMVRALCLAGACYPLAARFSAMVVLVLPMMLELAFYDTPAVRKVVVPLIPLLVSGFQVVLLVRSEMHALIIYHVSTTLIVDGIGAVAAVLLAYYRDSLVRLSSDNARLSKAVQELGDMNINYQEVAISAGETSARDERKRLTRELHDALGYTLTNIKVMMEAGGFKIDSEPERAKEILVMARQQATEGLAEVRKTLYALRDREDGALRGLNAISRLISVFRVASQVEVKVHFCDAPSTWDEATDSAMFQFVREALTNAVKHGGADRIEVVFRYQDATLEAVVLDNGLGPAALKEGMGIQGMRERLGPLGGTLSYRNTPAGFEIRATVPLKE